MNFALIPVSKSKFKDEYFYHIDSNGDRIWTEDHLHEYWDRFVENGHVIHTIDMYDSYDEIDFILLYWPDWSWIKKLTKAGQNNKIVYMNSEPPTVIKMHTPEGYKRLKRMFPYILSWNSDLVDNVAIFRKPIHCKIVPDFSNILPKDRKLITGITACKYSDYSGELYSERERAYSFFESHYPGEFDLYGWGWDIKRHPSYKGSVDDKIKTLQNYRFAICLENTRGLKDYVSEKMYDCLCAGVVPVYGGASNVTDYVPKECFIDYFSFDSLESLAEYITNMPDDIYGKYLAAGRDFIENTDHSALKYYMIAESIMNAVSHPRKIKISFSDRVYIYFKGFKNDLVKRIKHV